MRVILLKDVGGFGGPNEWFGIVVVDVVADRHDQLLDIAEDPTAELVLSEITEEPLHHVEPRCDKPTEPHYEFVSAPIQVMEEREQ